MPVLREQLEWRPIRGKDGITQIGVRYRYAWPELGSDGRRRISRFRARARHITGDGLIIPTLPGEKPRAEKTREIDPEEPGWVYAQKGMVQ
ncbi:MAG: hypothetical protein D6717_04715 [Gammaproteobacteria bacterium]|nr:MAG: hypothetical protein D6717_04715 [Gammaproteobacteria bacterium]